MPELKERFSLADELDAPDLWAEARRRAAAPEAPRRAAREWPPGAGRRAAVGALAFAVFAVAIAFAWDLANPGRRPAPRPPAVVDLAAELPVGWSELPAPPENRSGAATAWTGSELLVWGGYEFVGGNEDPQASGFGFDARERRWSGLPASPLRGRSHPAFAWTGSELLVWGGWDGGVREPPYFDDGAAYDPIARTWRMLPPAPLSARSPFSVWTGDELIVWGSTDRSPRMRDGAAYDTLTDSWRRISDAPTNITDGSAVWTGDEMIVFGAALDANNQADTPTAIGIAYNPETDSWRELPPSDLSPQAMTASWLDGDMIAWDYDQATAAYDPTTDSWRSLPDSHLDFSECYPKSVATPAIVLGEFCGRTIALEAGEDRWREVSLDPLLTLGGCCWVLEPMVAGDVVLVPAHFYASLGMHERRFFVFNPAGIAVVGDGEVREPEPFVPDAVRDGSSTRMPVVFPDGARAVVVYPNELSLASLGVQPDVSYLPTVGSADRYPIVFLHDPEASLRDFVDGEAVGSIPASQSTLIWRMSERWRSRRLLPEGHWLSYQLPSWRVLVALPKIEVVDEVVASLVFHEVNGFPTVETTGRFGLAEGFGESEGPTLSIGDRTADPINSTLDATIFLGPSGCAGFETEISPDYGAVCLASGRVFASIYGTGGTGFVARVVEGLRIEDFRAA
jgi:hypothetical protein